ncbi:MAG: OmpA family protein [Geminicoccaceae bacterium]|nr:OmpA family protein [Geminicoccaceae bacterium]
MLDKKDKRGVPVGAAAGAAVGAGIGSLFDRQQRAFEDTLSQERAANEIQVERVQDNLLKLTLDSEVSFDFDSATLRPEFRDSVQKLASVLNKYTDTDARIVGHTDSRGADAYNQTLSERRAVAVQQALISDGVAPQRLSTQGMGERQPRATNDTEAGRQLNRRVEIFVSPANGPAPVS